MEIANEQARSRNIIRVTIRRYWQPPEGMLLFEQLTALGNAKCIYKSNFCAFKNLNDIEYPASRVIDIDRQFSDKGRGSNVVLCLNQVNLRQLPFFAAAIEKIVEGNRISKIVGHPSSLFLALLIDPTGKCDSNMKEAILHYKEGSEQAVRLRAVTKE
jgi:hypothetical protein